jgi:NTP pyrophosphatase (non-canonical NTP hydrolase)
VSSPWVRAKWEIHMTPKQYSEFVRLTESNDFIKIRDRLYDRQILRLTHSVMGVANESGELMEILKKHVFYGTETDRTHLIEEYGDPLWYIALGLDSLGISITETMEKNVAKLKARYPSGKFDAKDAVNRDIEAEKSALEK